MSSRRPFLLRINAQLYEELERWAQQEMRSVNGQIEFLLRQAVARRTGRDAAEREDDKSDPRAPNSGKH